MITISWSLVTVLMHDLLMMVFMHDSLGWKSVREAAGKW